MVGVVWFDGLQCLFRWLGCIGCCCVWFLVVCGLFGLVIFRFGFGLGIAVVYIIGFGCCAD